MLVRRWKTIGLLITDGNGTAVLEKRLEIKQTNIYLPPNPANILLSIYPQRNKDLSSHKTLYYLMKTPRCFLRGEWLNCGICITGYYLAINE